ncbi:MAG: hypothetical protein WAK55_14635 [Xanthobacteraceae bacterium]
MPAMHAKRKREPERTSADLLSDLNRLHAEVEAFLDKKLAELKATRDGAGLPIQMLRRMLIGADPLCPCQLAQKLANDEIKQMEIQNGS